MLYELVHGNIYWNNRNHYTTRKWSLSRCLEDCCQPLTTIGKMQPCMGTNLATALYHPHSRHQKLSFHQLLSNCSTRSSRLHAPKQNFLNLFKSLSSPVLSNVIIKHDLIINIYGGGVMISQGRTF